MFLHLDDVGKVTAINYAGREGNRRLAMTPDELRAIMSFLQQRVHLTDAGEGDAVTVGFDAPTPEEMAQAGLNPEGCTQILNAPWWDEMVADIVETPEMCDPGDAPEQVLEYARDVVAEYIRKRASL